MAFQETVCLLKGDPNILRKAPKGSILTGNFSSRLAPEHLVELCNNTSETPKPLKHAVHNQFPCFCSFAASQGQLPRARATCNPERHFTSKQTGFHLSPFHVPKSTAALCAAAQHPPLKDLDVSSSFLCQTWPIQTEITMLEDCLGWGCLLAFVPEAAARAISPISSNKVAISEVRYISAKEMNVSQNSLQNRFSACSKTSTTTYTWEELMPSYLQKYLWILTESNKLQLFVADVWKYSLVSTSQEILPV